MSDHIRDRDGNVIAWSLARLSAEAMTTGDPALLDRLDRGTRLVRDGLAAQRAEDGLPPVGTHDPHAGHDVRPDEHGVEVCWTCTASDALVTS